MNLRLFSIAILISALPMVSSAAISIDKSDFIAAERVSKNGETVMRFKLSKSGKAKLKKLGKNSGDKEVHAEIAGVSSNFKIKETIKGDGLEMGPYSPEEAQKIIHELNDK